MKQIIVCSIAIIMGLGSSYIQPSPKSRGLNIWLVQFSYGQWTLMNTDPRNNGSCAIPARLNCIYEVNTMLPSGEEPNGTYSTSQMFNFLASSKIVGEFSSYPSLYIPD